MRMGKQKIYLRDALIWTLYCVRSWVSAYFVYLLMERRIKMPIKENLNVTALQTTLECKQIKLWQI